MGKFDRTIASAVRWLSDKPSGGDTVTITQALDLSISHVTQAMRLAAERGVVVRVPDPVGKAHNRCVFFSPEHGKGKQTTKPVKVTRDPRQRTRDPMGIARAERTKRASAWTSVRGSDGVLRTVAPRPEDPRFTVKPEEVVPVFGSLQLGSYLPGESWAARVYG